MDLTELDGITSRQIKLLHEGGIQSVEALAMTPRSILEDVDGVGEKTARTLIWEAREQLGMSEFAKASEEREDYEFIHSGSQNFDRILGGGVRTGKLTEVFGPFKSGKSNICSTCAVTAQLPKEKGGLDGCVAWIDTENTFSKQKIKRIARRFGLDPEKSTDRIFKVRIFSTDHQVQMIRKSEELCKDHGVRLIILDSLMALLRNEYIGIGKLAPRQAVLNNMLHALSRIAESYNCAVLLTNQVATQMKGMFSSNDAIGGNIVAHGCHFRVSLKTKGFSANSSLKRRAVIVDAPDLPPEECEFYITSYGIADTKTVDVTKPAENIGTKGSIAAIPANGAGLDKVSGIGPATLKKFKKAGVACIKDLLVADSSTLEQKLDGISKDQIDEFKGKARPLVAP